MTDSTSKTTLFPYTHENFDGREFLKNRDNFALKAHIKSVKIFEMAEFGGENAIDSANLSDSAIRVGAAR